MSGDRGNQKEKLLASKLRVLRALRGKFVASF